ncbi:flagellar hook-basal body complex protein [Oligoflexia bacterium]|nr:flagellar hook-basal body complex protein [Oligoflexia bacterium]
MNTWHARGYVNSEDVDVPANVETGHPRLIGDVELTFNADGTRSNAPLPTSQDIAATIGWENGSSQTNAINFTFSPFTQYSSSSNILSITQDGKGIGAVTSVSIEANGDIFALLDNGQASVIGTVALINFANPEGLNRIGANRLQQSIYSGEPIVGEPTSGTFGAVQSGSLELSTVDIANEFVKLITLQRGFQASSRIITTINQLLNEIIQLV